MGIVNGTMDHLLPGISHGVSKLVHLLMRSNQASVTANPHLPLRKQWALLVSGITGESIWLVNCYKRQATVTADCVIYGNYPFFVS